MNKADLELALDASVAHSVVVSVSPMPDLPGILRVLTVHSSRRVSIEFPTVTVYLRNDWEGGDLKYTGQYKNIEELVSDLESYLGVPIAEWRRISMADLAAIEQIELADYESSLRLLEKQVREHSIDLPQRAAYDIGTVYWRHVEKYGEYREDKLFEEQEDRYRHLDEEPTDPKKP